MMKSLSLKIDGMSCQHCVNRVKEALNTIKGVSDLHVVIGKASFKYDSSRITLKEIEEVVTKVGYNPHLL